MHGNIQCNYTQHQNHNRNQILFQHHLSFFLLFYIHQARYSSQIQINWWKAICIYIHKTADQFCLFLFLCTPCYYLPAILHIERIIFLRQSFQLEFFCNQTKTTLIVCMQSLKSNSVMLSFYQVHNIK